MDTTVLERVEAVKAYAEKVKDMPMLSKVSHVEYVVDEAISIVGDIAANQEYLSNELEKLKMIILEGAV